MSFADVSDRLTRALGLDLPPVALAFLDAPPPGVAVDDALAPSACSFWRRAEAQTVYAPAKAHYHCQIGAHVMGFDLPAQVGDELGAVIGQVVGNGYIGAEEPANLPRLAEPRAGILYGPLAGFPVPPDAVLLWLTPAQAMVWSEASGGAAWGAGVPSAAFGRPACAAVPASLDADRPVLSLGCIGMRTFTAVPADRMLAVAPGAGIAAVAEAVAAAAELNVGMRGYYEGRLAAVS